jgi:hypothetical protein
MTQLLPSSGQPFQTSQPPAAAENHFQAGKKQLK